MTHIDHLNRMLDCLGRVKSGTLPRFKWMYSPDMPYWRDRLGSVWVLAQWRPPQMSEKEWLTQFGSRYPYPTEGMYHAFPETALDQGLEPTAEATMFYLNKLDAQMSLTETSQLIAAKDDQAANRRKWDNDWEDEWKSNAPAFNNFAPGKRGASVSFGGV